MSGRDPLKYGGGFLPADHGLLAAPTDALHRCDMCGVVATPDPVVGCVLCGWDEMRQIKVGDYLFTADRLALSRGGAS